MNARAHKLVAPAQQTALPTFAFVHAEALDEDARTARVVIGGARVAARLDDALDAAVVRTAIASRERLVVERAGEEWSILGALRTRATPGVDQADELVIEARRVVVRAAEDLSLVSGAAQIALRARGYVETLAESITTRAAAVHKIVGRVIRIN